MPNTGRTQKGSSLRQRLDTAARLTAEESRARKNRTRDVPERAGEGSSRSSRRNTETRERSSTGSRRRTTDLSHEDSQRSSRSRQTGASDASGRERARSSDSRSSSSRSRSSKSGTSSRSATREAPAKPKVQVPAFVEKLLGLKLGTRIIAGVVAFVVVAVVLLYPVGQTYYQSLREMQLLQARIDAEQQYNEAVSKKNEELKTDEGIEAEAREQFGLVKKGEQAAIVTNKDGSSVEGADSATSKLPNQVDLDSVEPPHTWYYDILDVIFFVHLQ